MQIVGFNLVKLMKGLKKRWLRRLFLRLQAVDGIASCIARLVRLAVAELARLAEIPRSPSGCPNWGFA